MNTLDLIVGLALAAAAFNGWRKGLIGKLFSLAGLVGGVWLALSFGTRCGEALHLEGTTAAAVGFVGKAFSTIGLGGLDTLLGIALALLQAVLLLGLAFKAADYFDPALIGPATRGESKCYGPLMRATDAVFPPLRDLARDYLRETPQPTEKTQEV